MEAEQNLISDKAIALEGGFMQKKKDWWEAVVLDRDSGVHLTWILNWAYHFLAMGPGTSTSLATSPFVK